MKDPVQAAYTAIERVRAVHGSGLNATLAFDPDAVLEQAGAIAARSGGTAVTGLTLGIKDNISTLEWPTTCGSRILDGYRAPYEATAIAKLKAAGAILVAKTNMDEFGMGSSTEYSAFGPCQHPLDPGRVPGGSSGGSAALVAVGAVDAALGSETGGSVRQPAAFCGVVGFKPSYGCVSRYGLVAFGSSLDQIGVFARDVRTAADVVGVISGADDRDSTSAARDPVVVEPAPEDLDGVTVGVPAEYLPATLDPAIRRACDRTIAVMREAGATVRTVSLPHADLAAPCYYVIAPAEASANLARYDGVRYGLRVPHHDIRAMYRATRGAGFGPEVRRRIVLGTYVLSAGYYEAYYGKAQQARRVIAEDFRAVFDDGVDLLFTPTTPTPAFERGRHVDDPVRMYTADVFVCAANLAGIPALSLPIGRTDGLPVGGQLLAPMHADGLVLRVAETVQHRVDGTAEG